MKNNNLIQEEINRATQLWGYDTSRTIFEQQLGDANSDGLVDQADVDWVNSNWLQAGDVHDSNDGIVNLDDMTLVVNNWGQGQSTGGSCDAPTSLNVTNITHNSATLNWGAVTNATSYEVVSSEQGDPAWTNLPSVTNPTIDNTGLMASTTYEFAVRAVCPNGTSDWSVGGSGYQESGITPELYDTTIPPGYNTGGSTPPPTPPPASCDPPPTGCKPGEVWAAYPVCLCQPPTPPPTPPCNKSCQQLAPRFKKVLRTNMSKRKNPKRWLTNRIERLNNKLEGAKGQCKQKRLKCKLAVLNNLIKR